MSAAIAATVPDTRLAVLRNGYTPLPIPAGQKGPMLAGWQRGAIDEATVRRWGAERPDDTNTGIRCGEVIGIDLDVLDAGLVAKLETLALLDLGDGAPRRTGRAPKVMLIFRAAEAGLTKLATRPFTLGGQKAQVEVLATGQQFVAFGTHPDTGRPYVWADKRSPANTPLADLPEITLDKLRAFIEEADRLLAGAGGVPQGSTVTGAGAGTADRTPPPSEEALAEFIETAPNTLSERQDWIGFLHGAHGAMCDLRAAGRLTEAGEARIENAIQDWNDRYDGPQDDEPSVRWEEIKGKDPKGGWRTCLRYGASMGMDTSRWALETAQAEFAAVPLPAEPTPHGKLRLLTLDDLDAMPDPSFIIEGLLPEKSLTTVYGPPKQGKTFVVLSLSMHVAAGRPWFGRAAEQGAVVYIAGEGSGGMKHRARALRTHHGMPGKMPFWIMPRAVHFGDVKAVADLAALIRETAGPSIKLLVIDTLARATPGMDENSAGDMGRFVAECDKLKEAFGCTVIVVHHSGKDASKGGRGSSALPGAVDTSFQVTRQKTDSEDVVTVSNEYQKEAEEAAPLHFALAKVETGSKHGSLVPVLRSAGAAKASKLTGAQAAAHSLLTAALHDRDWATEDAWREACVAEPKVSNAPDRKSRVTAFRRAYKALLEAELVSGRGGRVWLGGSAEPGSGPELAALAGVGDKATNGDIVALSLSRQTPATATDSYTTLGGVACRRGRHPEEPREPPLPEALGNVAPMPAVLPGPTRERARRRALEKVPSIVKKVARLRSLGKPVSPEMAAEVRRIAEPALAALPAAPA